MGGFTVRAVELIEQVHIAGGRIQAKGDKLNLSAPEPLPADLMERLRQHKPEIMAYLQQARPVTCVYRYQLKGYPRPMTMIAPGSDLMEAERILRLQFGERLVDVVPHELQRASNDD